MVLPGCGDHFGSLGSVSACWYGCPVFPLGRFPHRLSRVRDQGSNRSGSSSWRAGAEARSTPCAWIRPGGLRNCRLSEPTLEHGMVWPRMAVQILFWPPGGSAPGGSSCRMSRFAPVAWPRRSGHDCTSAARGSPPSRRMPRSRVVGVIAGRCHRMALSQLGSRHCAWRKGLWPTTPGSDWLARVIGASPVDRCWIGLHAARGASRGSAPPTGHPAAAGPPLGGRRSPQRRPSGSRTNNTGAGACTRM